MCVFIVPVDTLVLWHTKLTEPEDGSSFNVVLNLGQRVPSREEKTGTGLECKGCLWPAFEVAIDGTQLTPDANMATSNTVFVYEKK